MIPENKTPYTHIHMRGQQRRMFNHFIHSLIKLTFLTKRITLPFYAYT